MFFNILKLKYLITKLFVLSINLVLILIYQLTKIAALKIEDNSYDQ
jgi:hypothetical protein